jgi:purine nucleoside permease
MRFLTRAAMILVALAGIACHGSAQARTEAKPCAPGAPCAHPLQVRMVIVTMFEIGKDTGDAPGEFQLWKERRHLDTRIPFPQSYHDLYYNPQSHILAMVTGVGNIRSAAATMALGLDPRFDLRHAYFLVAGIAGIDPHHASIGSAAWARYLVDGDLAHEIDPREIPADWKYGYFPRDRRGPNDPRPPHPTGEVFEINGALRDWAFALTSNVTLPDNPSIATERARFAGFPDAQRPPFVLKGDQLAALTFWHGKLMTDWANDWVNYWTEGKGTFVTSAMEETGTYQSILYLDRVGKVDKRRFMVLRAGSNYTMPPPGVSAADNLLRENEGYSGLRVSLESLYLVGSRVIDELLGHWDRYSKVVPG